MQTIKEFWESLVDRVRNPILTGFVIAWVILNYKLILVLLADEHYTKKFEYIERTLYADSVNSTLQLFIIPILFSAVYVFVLPGVALLSTWASSTYERLHSNVRTSALREITITSKQRDEIRREAALIVEKAHKEAQDAIAARIDTSRSTRENVVKLFSALMPTLFESLQIAPNWKGPIRKPEHGRTVAGTPEQNEFLGKYGIPEKWAELFMAMRSDDSTRIDAKEAAKRLNVTESEALGILAGLCALAMMDIDWVDNSPYFTMRESSWVALLNGRPA
ncbi:hypothetical protein [Paucibacter sp. XJ19-41]|uniref:hypothetical protein n=1 Tax=Paucibacter sp. XJ19-41 TaxID=2927824 RepID=UPI00234AE955|nr:hypothetical protein [Paucibacter sp. XJ19-41]MDC6168185.1 hypothetical protein [Paucibacter sp. XJ19-41]